VKEVAPAVLRHRLILSLEAQAEEVDVEGLVRELLLAVEVP
jgi:MoxR-like ATPase